MKVQQLGQLITQTITAQQPNSTHASSDCVETIYIETRSTNGVIQERIVRRSGGFCIPSTESGIKILDGLFLKNHMANDGRSDLVQRYNNHRKAIILIAQNANLSKADLITLVNDFNRIWAEQTTSVAKIDTSTFEERLCGYLEPMIKSIYEAAIRKIPDIIAAAINAAKSSDWSAKGFVYYLDKAKSGEWKDKGLDYYLDKAKSSEWKDKGLDYYLGKAKSSEWNAKGLDFYLGKAKSSEWNDKGLNYWKRVGKSSDWNKKGYGYLKKYEERCRLAHWDEVKAAYDSFKSTIQRQYDVFVKNIQSKHSAFEKQIKADHTAFETEIKQAHSSFAKTSNDIYKMFVTAANDTKTPTIQELKRLEGQSIEAGRGQSRLQAVIKKIDGAPATLRALRKGLSDGVERVSGKLSERYRTLSTAFAEKHATFENRAETGYDQLSAEMAALYRTLGNDFKSANNTMRNTFDEFLRKYD